MCQASGEAGLTVQGQGPGSWRYTGGGRDLRDTERAGSCGAGVARPPEARGRCANAGTVRDVAPSGAGGAAAMARNVL